MVAQLWRKLRQSVPKQDTINVYKCYFLHTRDVLFFLLAPQYDKLIRPEQMPTLDWLVLGSTRENTEEDTEEKKDEDESQSDYRLPLWFRIMMAPFYPFCLLVHRLFPIRIP